MSPRLHRALSDERLGSRLALGEAAAFDELYRRYVHRLAAYGTHLLGDASSGDDVAQVALMRAYQALRGGRAPQAFRPWLYRIAHNAAIDLVRSRHELPASLLPQQAEHARDVTSGALVTAIAALPERQRRVYVLRELHGMRIDETAAELGLTAQQVEQSLFAARNRLAEQLVFGERLGCTTVRRLAAGPLDMRERRALKTHLRSCPACRSELGARGIALTVLPAPSAEWLRGLLGVLGGGGAPIAAKVGAVVATATVAASVPLVVDPHLLRHLPQTHLRPATHVRHVQAPLLVTPVAHGGSAPGPVLAAPGFAPAGGAHAERSDTQSLSSGDSSSGGDGGGGQASRDGGGDLGTATQSEPTSASTTDGGGGGSSTDGGTTSDGGTSPTSGSTSTTSTGGGTSSDGGTITSPTSDGGSTGTATQVVDGGTSDGGTTLTSTTTTTTTPTSTTDGGGTTSGTDGGTTSSTDGGTSSDGTSSSGG